MLKKHECELINKAIVEEFEGFFSTANFTQNHNDPDAGKVLVSHKYGLCFVSTANLFQCNLKINNESSEGFEILLIAKEDQGKDIIRIAEMIEKKYGRLKMVEQVAYPFVSHLHEPNQYVFTVISSERYGIRDMKATVDDVLVSWKLGLILSKEEYSQFRLHEDPDTFLKCLDRDDLWEVKRKGKKNVHPPARQVAYEYFSDIEGVNEPPIKDVTTKNLTSIGIIETEEEEEYYVPEGEEEEEYMNSVLYCTVGWSDIPTNRVNDGLPVRNEIVFYGHKRIPEYNEMVISILDEIAGKGGCLYEDLVIENAFDRYGVDLGKSDMKHLVFMLPHQVSECTKSFFCAEGCLQFFMPEPISDKELEYLKEHGSYKLFWEKITETDRDDVGTFWRMCSFDPEY